MRNKIQFLLFMLSLLVFTNYGFAQTNIFDSLKIIPTNPTANDDIKLVIHATFSSGSCDLNNYNVVVQEGNITVITNFTVGDAEYICSSADTVSLGSFTAGSYELTALLTINLMEAIFDTETINFEVSSVTFEEELTANTSISIHPNPVLTTLKIESDLSFSILEIFEVTGKKVREINMTSSIENINVSDLKSGVYFVVLTDDNGVRHTKKMVKITL